MKNIELNDELAGISGGLSWGTGFLLGVTPVATLGLVAGAAYWLMSGYSDYLRGLDEGIAAANKTK
ncbi:hypothetical protein [Oleiharenicola sp. Vm1]|uniref:hypothetical protein n=1 Tax=Oleiharenicola sp. Vm1 TaxID=3398393 RepID=UPI0039F4DDDB